MKSLLILRHAEAVPTTPQIADSLRALTPRGRAQAQALGTWLQARGVAPDRILCSAAVRAQETADIVAAAAGWTTPVCALDELYNASDAELLAQAKHTANDANQLLLVAHAPGVADLVKALTSKQRDFTLTCDPATFVEVVFDVACWSELTPGGGALRILLPA
jgi:phosphohistidine phosphatase